MKVSCDKDGIETAVRSIRNGGVIVFPTDTVYGLGCDPYNPEAIKKIYEIKKRESSKLFPILAYSKKDLSDIVVFDEKSNKIAEKFWPGQVTLVLEIKDKKIKKSMNAQSKIAVRVPNNSCALALLKECKLLVGTSANVSDMNSFTNPDNCFDNISGYDIFVDGGTITGSGESTVVEVDDDKLAIHREGAVSETEIMKLF
ncbi:MAG: L-threonylcarbamoyladenylate synthase [Nitrosopumilaceae archaeon]|nr:L-threonylcarbamoyladenylate synthase [Nitrosopumilaceae archaeon]